MTKRCSLFPSLSALVFKRKRALLSGTAMGFTVSSSTWAFAIFLVAVRCEATNQITTDIRDEFLEPCRAHETAILSQLVYRFGNATHLDQVPPLFTNNHWIDRGSTEVLVSQKVETSDQYNFIPPGSGVVTFRGTEELIADWIVNLDAFKVPFGSPNRTIEYTMYQPSPDGQTLEPYPIMVHRGFNRMFGLYEDILEAIDNLELSPNATLYVNGHSLGGANAQLFAVYHALSNPTRRVQLTTFGAPRVGNRGFKLFSERLKNLNMWRVVNLNDIVTRLPFDAYEHAGHLYWRRSSKQVKAFYRQIGDKQKGFQGIRDFSLAVLNSINEKDDIADWIGDHFFSQYLPWLQSSCRNPTSYNATLGYEAL